MKVKLTGHWGAKGPGETVTVDESTAQQLVDAGVGNIVDGDEPAAPKASEPRKS